jgi:predicted Zn-dependent peptidase
MIETHTLENGLTLIAEVQPWQPGVSFELQVMIGAATEASDARGVTTVLEDWMYRGAQSRDGQTRNSRQLSEALDDLGVRRGGGAGVEGTGFSGALLSSDLRVALELYTDVIRRPVLSDHEFAPCVELARQELESLEDAPAQKMFTALRERFVTTPHGRSSMGTFEGLEKLTPEITRSDYRSRFGPRGAILGVAGGFNWDALVQSVTELFGDWEGQSPTLGPPAMRGGFYEHITQDTAQEQIGLMYPDIAPGDAGWYESRLSIMALSGVGASSRLYDEVREKRGLVYSVSASSGQLRGGGWVSAYAGTAPDRAQETLEVMLTEFARMRQGVRQDELEHAKTGLLTSLVMSEESSGARARGLVRDQSLLGRVRPLEEIMRSVQAITLKNMNTWLEAHPYTNPAVMTLGPKALELPG